MRKLYVSEKPYFITSRMLKGLPMVCSKNMNLIIEGIMARALELYPVKVCHYKFMQNHLHGVIVALDPNDAASFIGYLKGEIAHAVNNMLGVHKHPVWESGYDSPIMLDAETCINKIIYLYANAAKANLIESIDNYPGVSSWELYKTNNLTKTCFRVPRERIFKLERPDLSVYQQQVVEKTLKGFAKKIEFSIQPDAWMDCFEDYVDKEHANKEIISRVYELEKEYQEKREKEEKTVIGVTGLKRQSMAKEYVPKKYSKRMICLGASKTIRAPFISVFKELSRTASLTYEKWKDGDFKALIPPGMFAPRKPHLVCCLEVL